MDVKTAFLNGIISEEIYMEIPDGVHMSVEDKRSKVCKLERALYGLKISPKKWNERFSEVARQIELVSDESDPCLFIWKGKGKLVMLLLYVDDILLTGNDSKKMNEIKIKLKDNFQMKDLGEPKEFLGINIVRKRENSLIELNQEKYIDKILKRFKFEEMHPQRTPMVTTQVLNRERRDREEENSKNETNLFAPYREAVGSLLYLACATRPDISYAVNVLSRHQSNPTFNEWKMVKRVFRYLKGTKQLPLCYRAQRDDLQAFADASFADCKNSLTTCGYIIQLFGDTVAWRTHKQTYVALSTCQAEYVAMSEACQELVN